jgi:Flp pilus assembly protein CpaB
MNTKAVIPLVAGLGIAGLAAKLGLDYVKKAQGSEAKTVDLWSVLADVPRGVAIDDTMLVAMKFPAEIAPTTAIAEKSKLIGRVPHTGVPAGVPVLDTMLLAPGTKAGVFVPPGFRAVAVKIDESSGVDNHLQPGCRVDVVGYFTIKNANGKPETIARTIIENVEVAAVGQRIAAEAPAKTDPKDKKASTPKQEKPARATTLLVKPDQVPTLLLAEQKGEIKLSMRGSDDASIAGRDDKVKEGDVTGAPSESPPPKNDEFEVVRSGPPKKEESKPEVEVQPEPAEPLAPQYDYTMVIYLGNEKKVLGWLPGKPHEPVELNSNEGNIFERSSQRPQPPAKLKPGANPPPETPAQPEQPETPPAPQPEEQPKELIG